MAIDKGAELSAVYDGNIRERGLGQFDSEAQPDELWIRPATPITDEVRLSETSVVPSTAHTRDDELWIRAASPSTDDVDPSELSIVPPTAPTRRWWPVGVPVVLIVVIAGSAAAWFGMRLNEPSILPPAPLPPALRAVARAEPLSPPPVTETLPLVDEAPPVAPEAKQAEAASTPTQPTPPPIDPALARTLAAVSQAYRALDAPSLTAVWPTADIASLSQTFSQLKYQRLSFENCAMRPNGPNGAVASCEVSIATAPRAGDPALRRRHESWTLVLNRPGERWTIASVFVR
jgi:hypothetical protein